MPESKTRAWHRAMPAITVIAIPFYVLCMDSTLWKFTAFREVRPACMWACAPALGTDLDTGPENVGFAVRQACVVSWAG